MTLEIRPTQLLLRLGLDAALWLCLPAAFLWLYVERYFGPQQAVTPHLRFILVLLLGFAAVRFTLALLIRSQTAYRLAAAAAASALFALMSSYYALVLVGLHSWGRVITWELMQSYSTQIPFLAEVVGVSLPAALCALTLFGLGVFTAAWYWLRRMDWAPALASRVSIVVGYALVVCASVVCGSELYRFASEPATRQSEPLSLTFYPAEGMSALQGWGIDRLSAAKLDAAEDQARKAYQPAVGADRRNVVLIVVDALRPDHMGIYGYGRNTTPNLVRLEQAGITRKSTSMRAVCSSSACGLMGIASSKFLHQVSYHPFTLHEALRRHGYRVHLLLSGDHTSFYALNTIYGEVDSYFDGQRMRNANDDRQLLEHLEGFAAWDGTPVMLQFHLMSTHPLGRREDAFSKFAPAERYSTLARRKAQPLEAATNFYDNSVLQADAVVGTLLATLQRKGYLRNALVAITADHGELLGEHDRWGHRETVWEEALRVPFILLSYGERRAQPLAERALVSQIDIAPTLLAELGLPRPRTWIGAPLQESEGPEFAYFQSLTEVGFAHLRDGKELWKYWIDSSTGAEYAFNLRVDPKEAENLVDRVAPDEKRAWRLKVLDGASVYNPSKSQP
jgi:glucan phosphoethanolaminetransferase (alkaline phosphatase superfamily)